MPDDGIALKLVTVYDGSSLNAGLDEAASSVENNAEKIKRSMEEAGKATEYSMMEARHSVMLVGEEFGVHLPRAVTTMIAHIETIGPALEAAFVPLAIIVGATILIKTLIEHFAKLREEEEKLKIAQTDFQATILNTFTGLDDKLLEAGIKADQLNGDHLAAVQKQLTLIDHQTLKDLISEFDKLEKAADAVLAQLTTHWYEFGIGSAGAKAALEQFKAQYGLLVAQKDEKGAGDLLAGTLESAKKVLEFQEQAKANAGVGQKAFAPDVQQSPEYKSYVEAINELKKSGVGYTEKEIEAQRTLIAALESQVTVAQKVDELKAAKSSEVVDKDTSEFSDKAAKEQAAEFKRVTDETEKLQEEKYKESVEKFQQAERQKIEATAAGSRERIDAIAAAIKEEETLGIAYSLEQGHLIADQTGYYKGLLNQRLSADREYQEKQAALVLKGVEEDAKAQEKIAEMADKENQKVIDDIKKREDAEIEAATKKNVAALGGSGGAVGSVVQLSAARGQLEELRAAEEAYKESSIANAREASAAKIAELEKVRAATVADSQKNAANAQADAQKIKDIDQQLTVAKQEEVNKEQDLTRQAGQAEWQYAQQYAKQIEQTQNQIANSFASSVDRMIFNSKNFHDAVTKLWEGMAKALIEKAVQIAAQWITQHVIMTAISKIFHLNEAADSSSAAAAKHAAVVAGNDADIASYAGVAAAAAYASYAELPPVAAAMAAAAAAAVLSFEGLGSAAGGYDVPGGIGKSFPTILHPREMVLPADLAGGVREMVRTGGNVTNTENGGNSVSVGKMIFSPTVNGGFDVATHGEEFFQYAKSKFRKMGLNI